MAVPDYSAVLKLTYRERFIICDPKISVSLFHKDANSFAFDKKKSETQIQNCFFSSMRTSIRYPENLNSELSAGK